jgi:ubiquitin carboxyl-terminal hydrolase 8
MEVQRTKCYSGLANLGNTCFLNACIQALNHTYELNDLLDKARVGEGDKYAILKEWNDLRHLMWKKDAVVAPNRFVANVQKIAQQKGKELFTGWSQNDMPEFLLFMIECIHQAMSRKVHIKISGKEENAVDELATKCYTMIQNDYAKDYSEIMDLFYGIYVSQITSIDGQTVHSIKPESYFVMNLPVPSKQKVSIYDCFDAFTKPEILCGENAWLNEKTGQKEDIKKNISFWNFPNILIITLKRFTPDGSAKNNGLISFPLVDLDLSRYISGYNPSSYKYDLYAICNHMGSVYGGHYTAFVRNYADEWIHYNDTNIGIISNPESIVTPLAYCLFYRKKNKLV